MKLEITLPDEIAEQHELNEFSSRLRKAIKREFLGEFETSDIQVEMSE